MVYFFLHSTASCYDKDTMLVKIVRFNAPIFGISLRSAITVFFAFSTILPTLSAQMSLVSRRFRKDVIAPWTLV